MKKAIFLILALALLFPVSEIVYAQGQETAPAPLVPFGAYRITRIEVENEANVTSSAFLKSINEKKAPAYLDSPAQKMGDGVINATTAWTDIPRKIGEVSEKENLFTGITVGLTEGIVSGLARGTTAVVDVATFGVPPYDKPIMQPEYKVNNPNEGLQINLLEW